MTNIYDVAKKAKVSTATVSRVINKKNNVSAFTRKKVLNAINKLGYTTNIVAKSLVTKKSNSLGVIMPDITNIFFSKSVKGIEDFAQKNNFNM